jgi:predicted Fe-Mo cluster-binding NifX family protein
MRICIPTSNTDGWDSQVAHHFGRAVHFAVVDTETYVVEFVDNQGRHHHGGKVTPAMTLLDMGLDAVICSGMGPRAVDILRGGGLDVLVGTGDSLREMFDQFEAGSLAEGDENTACKESRHSH